MRVEYGCLCSVYYMPCDLSPLNFRVLACGAGVVCRRVSRPISSVGLYVPGGTAVLPSSALMLAIPAALAGCKTIVLATPPRPEGNITPEVLYCARKAGVTHVLKAGGAQVGISTCTQAVTLSQVGA